MNKNKNKHTIKIIMAGILVTPMLTYFLTNIVFGGDIVSSDEKTIITDNTRTTILKNTTPDDSVVDKQIEPIINTSQTTITQEPKTAITPTTINESEANAPIVRTPIEEPVEDESGNIDITVTTDPDTDDVQYFVDDSKSSDDTYLGTGEQRESSTEWNLKLEKEKRLPSGEYEVYAKIKDGDREYETERTRLRIEQVQREQITKLEEDFGKLDPDLDFDGDGLSNSDEKRLGTNPYLADTDNDGYIDGDEVRNGFDPLRSSVEEKSDKITFENPKDKGTINHSYEVKSVELRKVDKGDRVFFSGKALSNTFVRVYIYSDNPIIVTVRTDNDGNWSYELDKELENGDHEVYVAVTDNTGKITSKSNPLAFVKTAEAISTTPTASAATLESPIEEIGPNNIVYAIIIIVVVFSISLIIIKTLMEYKKK